MRNEQAGRRGRRPLKAAWKLALVTFAATGATGANATDPPVSDDGNILFYKSAGLLRTNATGSFSDMLTLPPTDYVDESASWSPDGRHVVFQRRPGSREWVYLGPDVTIRVVDRLGQRSKPLASGKLPVWSGPGSNKIAFVHGASRDSAGCVALINPDGTGLQQLSCIGDRMMGGMYWCQEFYTCYPDYTRLAWSRDGKSIVAAVETVISSPSDLFVLYSFWKTDLATGQQSQIAGTPDAYDPMAFSMGPGSTMYFDVQEYVQSPTPIPSIYTVDIATGARTRITDGYAPRVSPNGAKLAFTKADAGNRYSRLYVINTDGTAQRRLTNPATNVRYIPLDWSSDSSQVLVQRLAPDRSSLHRVTATGSWGMVRSAGRAEADAWHEPVAP